MTVKLFKNSKVDGISRLGLWDTKASQIAYFDTLSSKTYTTNTVKLGDNLRINDKLSNLLGYGYGYIDYGDGFRYYFSVGDLIMVTETMTDISYTIDCYDTAITQLDNWAMKRASISRYPSKNEGFLRVPYEPNYYITTSKTKMGGGDLIALCYDESGNSITLIVHMPYTYLIDGTWMVNQQKYTPADIIACGIVSTSFSKEDIENLAGFTFDYEDESGNFIAGALSFTRALTATGIASGGYTLTNDGFTWNEVYDMRGNSVFKCPLGATLTYVDGYISISATSISEVYRYTDSKSSEYYKIVIPAEMPVIRSDEFAEYRKRGRAIDIESRNMSINQNFMSGLVNIGGSALTGVIGGGTTGMSATAGAMLGAGAGALGAIGNYAISSFYEPKEQNLIDKKYRLVNHSLLNFGSASADIFKHYNGGVKEISWDDESKDIYSRDVAENGYYVSSTTDDFNGSLLKGAITADVEVIGDLPMSWKEQIHTRFATGVKMV